MAPLADGVTSLLPVVMPTTSPVKKKNKKQRQRQQQLRTTTAGVVVVAAKLPVVAACCAGLCAAAELRESFSELGHHHGVALLSISHIVKALFVFDDMGEKALENRAMLKLLGFGALAAATTEVWRDLRPGGHHGTVLLSLSELHELFGHLFLKKDAARGQTFDAGLAANVVKGLLSAGALLCAAVEIAVDVSPGAHHGVAILALAAAIRSANGIHETLVTAHQQQR